MDSIKTRHYFLSKKKLDKSIASHAPNQSPQGDAPEREGSTPPLWDSDNQYVSSFGNSNRWATVVTPSVPCASNRVLSLLTSTFVTSSSFLKVSTSPWSVAMRKALLWLALSLHSTTSIRALSISSCSYCTRSSNSSLNYSMHVVTISFRVSICSSQCSCCSATVNVN